MILSKNKGKAADAVASSKKRGGKDAAASRLRPGVADYIAGESKVIPDKLYPYLPQELVGGAIPHVPGTEEEAVWNAASQACSTERVHYCYSVEDGRIWYLACPSAALASNPDSWVPLAAALPGRSEYWDRETVYLYEQEGMASALRWDPETGRMQVFLGASRTLLPRIQSMDANFVTVNPEVAEVVPWRNRALRTEKLSRASANVLLYSGLLVCVLAIIFLLMQYTLTGMTQRELASVQAETERVSLDLMTDAYNALQSDTIKHMVRIQELLDALQQIDGTLVKYEIMNGKVKWEAIVPPSFQSCGADLGRCQAADQLEPDGRIRITGTS